MSPANAAASSAPMTDASPDRSPDRAAGAPPTAAAVRNALDRCRANRADVAARLDAAHADVAALDDDASVDAMVRSTDRVASLTAALRVADERAAKLAQQVAAAEMRERQERDVATVVRLAAAASDAYDRYEAARAEADAALGAHAARAVALVDELAALRRECLSLTGAADRAVIDAAREHGARLSVLFAGWIGTPPSATSFQLEARRFGSALDVAEGEARRDRERAARKCARRAP